MTVLQSGIPSPQSDNPGRGDPLRIVSVPADDPSVRSYRRSSGESPAVVAVDAPASQIVGHKHHARVWGPDIGLPGLARHVAGSILSHDNGAVIADRIRLTAGLREIHDR